MPQREELFELMDGLARHLEQGPDDRAALNGLAVGIRAVADVLGVLGAGELARLQISVASLLELAATGELPLTPSVVTLLLEATDQCRDYLNVVAGGAS